MGEAHSQDYSTVPISVSPSVQTSDTLRRVALRPRPKATRPQVVVITGPPGFVFIDFSLPAGISHKDSQRGQEFCDPGQPGKMAMFATLSFSSRRTY